MKISKIISMFFFSIIFIYILMFLDTNSLFKQIEQHMLGEIELTPEIEQYIEIENEINESRKKGINITSEIEQKSEEAKLNMLRKDDISLYVHFNFDFEKKLYCPTAEKDKIQLKLRRIFVLHNFKDGTMIFTYSLIFYDKNGKTVSHNLNIPVIATIHKEDGKWYIVDVNEDPIILFFPLLN